MAKFLAPGGSRNVMYIAAVALLLLTGAAIWGVGHGAGGVGTAAASCLKAVQFSPDSKVAAESGTAVGAPAMVRPASEPAEDRFLRPSQDVHKRLLANPALLDTTPSLADDFVATPWLLPLRTRHLNYAGVTVLDEIMALRSQALPGYNKSVSFVLSSLHDTYTQAFAQNCVYGLVKFANVTNYIVATWTPEGLEACADLNLPCADIKPLLDAHAFIAEDKRVGHYATWFKPIVAQYAQQRGYVVHMSDSDVSYAAKPLWPSYLSILQDPPMDAAFQNEEMGMGPINTGNFVVLPTPGGINFMERWLAGLEKGFAEHFNDQIYIVAHMPRQEVFELCRSRQHCLRLNTEMKEQNRTVPSMLRTYMPPYWAYVYHDYCALTAADPPQIDLCDWQVLYVHACCLGGWKKKELLIHQTLWYMDDQPDGECAVQPNSTSKAIACTPLVWRLPEQELPVTKCAKDLALSHVRPKYTA